MFCYWLNDVFSDTNTKEVTFEAHKVPRETWVSEIEAIEAKIQKDKDQKEKEQKEKEEREKELNESVSVSWFALTHLCHVLSLPSYYIF